MVSDYVVNTKIKNKYIQFIRYAQNYSDECVKELAMLDSKIRELYSNLMRSLDNYPTTDGLHHKVYDANLGTFIATYASKKGSNIVVLSISYWDWRIHPDVYPNLYELVLQRVPIYDKKSDGGFGFTIVTDAKGRENYIKNDSKKKLPISTEWFQRVTQFQGNNNYLYGFVRRTNGDVLYIYEDGTLEIIDDNYTRQNAEALLGESLISQIIIEVINQYLRHNLILN